MKATRTKRMAALVGLLMALTLAATGCQIAPNPNGQQAAPIAAPSVSKVADFDVSMTTLDAEWVAAFGEDRAVSTPIAETGLKILSLMFDAHPEYTVNGFVPTDREWSAVSNELTPFMNAAAAESAYSKWNADKTLPVMTSYRSKLDKDGNRSYTYTTESGEKCTDSDKPYEYKTAGLSLTARPDENGTQIPVFSGNVNVTVHCKEGKFLQGQMYAWFPLVEVDGKRIILDTYEVNPAAPFELRQIAE